MTTIDYAGTIFTMESFSQSTDGSGDIVVTLANTPQDNQAILVFCQTPTRIVEFVSRSGANVTLRVRKAVYDRSDTGVGGTINNTPSGITISDASSIGTSSAASGNVGSSTGASGGQGIMDTFSHAHSFTQISDHDHSYTETDLPVAGTEAVLVTVGYAY